LYHYSQRLPWNFSSNLLSRRASERRSRGQAIIDLTRSNPTSVLSNYPHQQIADAFASIKNFHYEPDPLGMESARIAVAQYYEPRGITVSPGRLLLTASTSEAYALLFKLLCDAGDEILVPAPSYPLFDFLARLESVRVKNYRLEFDGEWYIDFDFLQRQITSGTRAIVLVNPNNPTGSFLKHREFQTLSRIAQERSIPLISDEVFFDYAFDSQAGRVPTLIRQDEILSFSLNGLSKAAGMPQMKLGWIAINGSPAGQTGARERLELIADTYLSVGAPVQRALPRLFTIGAEIGREIHERTKRNLQRLHEILHDSPAHALRCEGGWSAIIRLPATQPEESWTLHLLEQCGILVQPGYFFDMTSEPYIVVSLITPPDEFEQAILRIHEAVLAR